jgi:hypothetical protein
MLVPQMIWRGAPLLGILVTGVVTESRLRRLPAGTIEAPERL